MLSEIIAPYLPGKSWVADSVRSVCEWTVILDVEEKKSVSLWLQRWRAGIKAHRIYSNYSVFSVHTWGPGQILILSLAFLWNPLWTVTQI